MFKTVTSILKTTFTALEAVAKASSTVAESMNAASTEMLKDVEKWSEEEKIKIQERKNARRVKELLLLRKENKEALEEIANRKPRTKPSIDKKA